MQTTKPSTAQRNMNRRMTQAEADTLAQQFKARPYTAYYVSTSETTGKARTIPHADALYILTARGYIAA